MGKPKKPRPQGTLKQAQSRLIEAVGGFEKASDYTGLSISQLYRYTDPLMPDTSMPADVVRVLEAEAGEPVVTAFLAHEAGCILQPIETNGKVRSFGGAAADVGRQVSSLFAGVSEALADGAVSEREKGRICEETDAALTALGNLRRLVSSKPKGRGK